MGLQGSNISPLDMNLLGHWFDFLALGLIQFKGTDKGIVIKMMIVLSVILNRGVVIRALAIP